MTLLDKLTYFIKPGLAFLLIPFFFACDDPTELGLELEADKNPFSLKDTTLTLKTSTIFMDSLRTDQYNLLTVGRYQDTTYGEVKAISYNEYNVNGGTLPADSLEYESAHIIMQMNAVRSPNPVIHQELLIYEAQDTLYNQAVYLSDFSVPYDEANPLTSYTFDFMPTRDTIVNIPLPEAFGESLFTKLKLADTNEDYEDSLTNNRFFFEPLVFAPGADNEALLSFDLSPDTVAIYINMINPFNGNQYSYTFDFRDAHFVEVQRDISSSTNPNLLGLNEDFEEDSVSSRTHLDPLAGIYTKIDLKPLIDFAEGKDNLLVNLAQMTIDVANPAEAGVQPAKPPLQFYFVKEHGDGTKSINGPAIALANIQPINFILGYRNALLSETGYLSLNPQLLTVGYDKDDTNYKGTVTLFIQELIDSMGGDNGILAKELVTIAPLPLTLGQNSFSKSGIKLKVYYTTLN